MALARSYAPAKPLASPQRGGRQKAHRNRKLYTRQAGPGDLFNLLGVAG